MWEKLQQNIIQIIGNIVTRIFMNEKLAIKVPMDWRTTAAHNFRTRLRFKQYNIILTKEQSVLIKIMSSFEGENIQTNMKL